MTLLTTRLALTLGAAVTALALPLGAGAPFDAAGPSDTAVRLTAASTTDGGGDYSPTDTGSSDTSSTDTGAEAGAEAGATDQGSSAQGYQAPQVNGQGGAGFVTRPASPVGPTQASQGGFPVPTPGGTDLVIQPEPYIDPAPAAPAPTTLVIGSEPYTDPVPVAAAPQVPAPQAPPRWSSGRSR